MKKIPLYRIIPRKSDMAKLCYWLTLVAMGLVFGFLSLYCLVKG